MKTLTFLGALALVPALHGAIPLTGSGTVTQNFNTLPTGAGVEWNDNSTMPNWWLYRSNAAAPFPIPLLVNDNVAATAFAAGVYSFGPTGGADRAFGSVPTGTLGEISQVVVLQNTGALPIQITNIAFAIEKWRENTTAGITERIDFSYQKNIDEFTITSALGAGWTDLNNYDVVVPHSGTASAIHNPSINFPVSQAPVDAIVVDPGEYAAFRWLNPNESGSDAYLGLDDVVISYLTLDGAIAAPPHNIARDSKGTASLTDDTLSFTITPVGTGTVSPAGWVLSAALPAGWTGPASGPYNGDATFSNIPVTGPTVTLTIRDSATATTTRTITVSTPPVPADLTPAGNPIEWHFTAPATNSTSFSRTWTDGLTDLGWTSNAPSNGFNGIATRPGGGDPNQYFRLRNFKLNRFVTEPVNISAVSVFDASLQLATYTTSASAFEDGPANAVTFAGSDRFQVIVELSSDGGATWVSAGPSIVSSGQTGVSQFAEFKIADPGTGYTADAVVPSTLPAVVPFAVTRSQRYPTNGAGLARLAVLGGNDSDSENSLFDNIKFSVVPSKITASVTTTIRDNQGDDNPANDTFSFSIAVSNDDLGRPLGWTSSEAGVSGNYGNFPASFPFYPVSGGPRSITFTDVQDPAGTLNFSVPIPLGVLSATPPLVTRDEGAGPGPADDTWTFTTTVSAVNGGTGFTNTLNADSVDYNNPITFGPYPVSAGAKSVTFLDRSDNTWTTALTVTPPIRPQIATLVRTGAPLPVYQSNASLVTGWTEPGTPGTLVQVNGGGTTAHVLTSDPVDLSGISEDVLFYADFIAADSSAGTNFEANDTFVMELELTRPGGTERINLLTAAQDTGDGAPSTGPNGPANGVLNGFNGVAVTGVTVVQDYDANRERDEFNLPVGATPSDSAASFSSLFRFTAVIPDDVTSAQV
ncbi:MAG: endonuclease, partial [Verrucomicrobiales bacterium]|nr:endonuclease [Verrucomicrobiales bacterium]